MFEIATPNIISIIIYFCTLRLNLPPSNNILFFLGLVSDIMSGNNLGTTSIFLLLFKYCTEAQFFFKINKNYQDEWITFTIIFILTFSLTFLLNIVLNMSVPELSPIFFHIGATLILFPIVNIGVNFFNFLTLLIKS